MSIYINNILKLTQITLRNDIRSMTRWSHRTPKKVLTEEQFEATHRDENHKDITPNIIELDRIDVQREIKAHKKLKPKVIFEDKINVSKYDFDFEELDKKTHLNNEKEEKKIKRKVKYVKEEILDTTFDSEGNFIYTKMNDNDSKIGALMLMVKSKKLREQKEKILLEGKRLIRDALEVGCEIECLMFSRKNDLEFFKNLLPKTGLKVYKMAYRDMQMWSDLTTCPGIMAIVKMPNVENVKIQESTLPITVICDNIREPGNLGAILRTSVAVGCQNVILTKGCVDLWEPKVLRSASGAHFRLKIMKSIPWNNIKDHIETGSSIFLADNKILTSTIPNENAQEYYEKLYTNVPLLPYFSVNYNESNSLTLVIGGETLGLSEDAYKLALDNNGVRLNVPLENNVESLNTGTALGVIIFEIKRQFLTNK